MTPLKVSEEFLDAEGTPAIVNIAHNSINGSAQPSLHTTPMTLHGPQYGSLAPATLEGAFPLSEETNAKRAEGG